MPPAKTYFTTVPEISLVPPGRDGHHSVLHVCSEHKDQVGRHPHVDSFDIAHPGEVYVYVYVYVYVSREYGGELEVTEK